MTLEMVQTQTWVRICGYERIEPERGVAALVFDSQIAIFRTFDGALYAVGNQDPFTGAYVLARGICGTRGGVPTVASPLHKQVFDLRSGQCLDDESVRIPTYPVQVVGDVVQVSVGAEAGG